MSTPMNPDVRKFEHERNHKKSRKAHKQSKKVAKKQRSDSDKIFDEDGGWQDQMPKFETQRTLNLEKSNNK